MWYVKLKINYPINGWQEIIRTWTRPPVISILASPTCAPLAVEVVGAAPHLKQWQVFSGDKLVASENDKSTNKFGCFHLMRLFSSKKKWVEFFWNFEGSLGKKYLYNLAIFRKHAQNTKHQTCWKSQVSDKPGVGPLEGAELSGAPPRIPARIKTNRPQSPYVTWIFSRKTGLSYQCHKCHKCHHVDVLAAWQQQQIK